MAAVLQDLAVISRPFPWGTRSSDTELCEQMPQTPLNPVPPPMGHGGELGRDPRACHGSQRVSITVLGLCLLKQKNKPVQAVQGLRCCSRFVFLCPLRGQRGACGCELELWIWNSIPGNGAGPLLGPGGQGRTAGTCTEPGKGPDVELLDNEEGRGVN